VRGVVGKLLRVVEDSSSALVYFALSLGALHLAAPPGAGTAAAPQVAVAGWLGGPADTVVALGLALGLAAMMVCRYAFDVLIWLVPIPFVDFAFETTKKILTVGFLCLYFFSPLAAAALAFLLLVPAIALSPWALRIVRFAFHVLLRPALAWLVPELRPQLLDARLVARYAGAPGARSAASTLPAPPPDAPANALAPDAATATAGSAGEGGGVALAADAVALSLRGLPRRTHGALLRTADGVVFVTRTAFGRRRSWPLPGPREIGGRLSLVRALLWTEVRVVAVDGTVTSRVALPRSLDFDRLCALLGATGSGGAAGGDAATLRAPGRIFA
jgi:hypothetical protein